MSSLSYPSPQAVFEMQYQSVRRDEVVGVLLALFLGCFGIHHFYLGRVGLGILYCCFCWTGIPAILGIIECFFMPGRVRAYNGMQAAGLAAALGVTVPGWVTYPGWGSYPGWGAPAYAAAPVYVSVQPSQSAEGALVACANCRQVNPAGARFCAGCGTQIA
jgi:TM2 domain-containing membrane protein YozV